MILRKFCNLANRDQAARDLRDQGYRVTKRTSSNQAISPDYIEDYNGPTSPNGFGGSSPQFFAKVYVIEASR